MFVSANGSVRIQITRSLDLRYYRSVTTSRTLFFALAVVVLSLFSTAASASSSRSGDFGVGLVVGEPTGLTVQFRLARMHALDLAVGLDPFEDRDFYVHLDYLFLAGNLLGSGSVGLVPYVGFGGVLIGGQPAVGFRVPFGLALEFNRAPIQIFAEAAIRVILSPGTDTRIAPAVGFRFFF